MKYVVSVLLLAVLALTNAYINRVFSYPDENIVELDKRQPDCCPCLTNTTAETVVRHRPKWHSYVEKQKKKKIAPPDRSLQDMIRAFMLFGH